jgi:hypothetical protein
MKTEFEFLLPKGYLDEHGNLHRKGVMRLATAMDEIVPLRDPRVRSNPAYVTIMILSRVMLKLGAVDEMNPRIVEQLFACDLNYLQKFYRQINELEIEPEFAITPDDTDLNPEHSLEASNHSNPDFSYDTILSR